MPPKRKAPRGAKQQRRLQVLRRAFRDARAAREARRGEEQESAHEGDHDIEMSQAGSSTALAPAVQPITAENLVAVITRVLQA